MNIVDYVTRVGGTLTAGNGGAEKQLSSKYL